MLLQRRVTVAAAPAATLQLQPRLPAPSAAAARHRPAHGRRASAAAAVAAAAASPRFAAAAAPRFVAAAATTAAGAGAGAAAAAATDAAVDPAAAAEAQRLKGRIVELAGTRYGLDLTADARAAVVDAVQQLVALKLPCRVTAQGLASTVWTTVFTTSDGPSSGKVGPFVADVTQEFPAAAPGTYANISRLGLVAARLEGVFQATRPDRIDLEFKTLGLSVAGLTLVEKKFDAGAMRGHWAIKYADGDFRAFETNKGNLFVLRRLEGKAA